jgi:hypothetical protein
VDSIEGGMTINCDSTVYNLWSNGCLFYIGVEKFWVENCSLLNVVRRVRLKRKDRQAEAHLTIDNATLVLRQVAPALTFA